MNIRPMTIKDVEEVALLHHKTLPSIPTHLGLEFLKRMYYQLITHSSTHLNFVAYDEKNISGVITVSFDFPKTEAILHHLLSLRNVLQLTGKIITDRISLLRLLNRVIFEHQINKKLKKPYLYILTLFVDQKYQGRGIGRSLIKKILIHRSGKKFNIYADALWDNKEALRFYHKVGFKLKEKILDAVILQLK